MEPDQGMVQAPKFAIEKNKFFCVEYPGYVKNTDRALATLGHEKALATSLAKNTFVELRYRPNDPFSHPINGDIVPTTKLLLKVTRRVKKGGSEEEAMYKTEIAGTIPKSCRFRGLADFQYIVPPEDTTRQLKAALETGNVDALIQYKVADDDSNFDDLRNIPPPQFTTNETPFRYNFEQNATIARVRVQQPDGSFGIKLINRSRKLQQYSTRAQFEDDNIPMESAHELTQLSTQEAVEMKAKMEQLFDERPIWTKAAIKNHFSPEHHRFMNQCIAQIAYIFLSGPWRDCWVKFGVDPRKDQSYNIYQQMDVRRFYGANSTTYERAKRVRTLPRYQTQSSKGKEKLELDPPEPHDTDNHFDGTSKTGSQWVFQLCDITDPALTPIINNPKYLKSVCSKYYGYYYACAFERLRARLRKRRIDLEETGEAEPMQDIESGLAKEMAKEDAESKKAKTSLTAMVDDYMSRLGKTEGAVSDEDIDYEEYEDLLDETEGGAGDEAP